LVQRPMAFRALAVVLSFLAVIMTAPFSLAETFSASPLGTVVAPVSVTVGNTVAPTGTTIFAGDRVASDSPALINLNSGSRIEMTKAAATFNRQDNTLVVQANEGLLRFNFIKGEVVKINAGKYTFSSANDSAHVGELALNSKGEVIMYVGEGTFTALNNATGARSEVSLGNPIVAMDQSITKTAGAAVTGAAVQGRAVGKAEGFIPLFLLVLIIAGGVAGASVGIYEATKSP
jgi:hypothetical protein